jgi:hypothetical protein
MGLFKHFLFGFIPEMLMHTRSQGKRVSMILFEKYPNIL